MSLLNLFLLFLVFLAQQKSLAKQQLPQANFAATLIFGDSTVDTGNNNFIPCIFQSNHSPYGVDFPNWVPTGRFSNGLLIPDLLSSALNIKSLSPPWLDPRLSDEDIRTGVNFASAGAGYDDLTSDFTTAVPVSKQLVMFRDYVERLKGVVGEDEGKRVLENSLVMFVAGVNDFTYTYYYLPTSRRQQFNISGYQDFLLGKLEDAVKNVYSYGCRKFIIAGLPPIGHFPIQFTLSSGDPRGQKFLDQQQSDTFVYNKKLQNLLPELQELLNGSKLAYLGLANIYLEMLNDPEKYGFEETRKGCCGTGVFEVASLCNYLTPLCKNISAFAFFDANHATERVYKHITEHIMKNVIHNLY